MEFRVFDFLFDPTMQTTAPDGTILQTTASALDLLRLTAIPVYVPEGSVRGMVDREECLVWECVGLFGRIRSVQRRDVERIGTHMPDVVVREIQAWCEAYARAHPDTPMIGRTEIAYQRNSYTTTHTCLFTYNQLREYTDDQLRKYDTGSRRGTAQQAARGIERGGSSSSHGQRPARNSSRSRTRDVGVARQGWTDSMFDESSGGDRD